MDKNFLYIFSLILFFLFPSPATSGQDSSSLSTGRSSILLATDLAGWPYQFDQDQISRLRAAGCQFDDQDLAIANRMMNRKFSAEDFVAAYEQAVKMSLSKDEIEKLATFQFLFLPTEEYGEMKSKRMNVTSYYNSRIGDGKKMKIGGFAITGIGILFLIVGVVNLIDSGNSPECDPDVDRCSLKEDLEKAMGIGIGRFLTFKGAVCLMIGVPLIIMGNDKKKHWAKDLDSAPKDEMDKYRLSPRNYDDTIQNENVNSPENTKLTIGLSPLVTGNSDKPNGVALKIIF